MRFRAGVSLVTDRIGAVSLVGAGCSSWSTRRAATKTIQKRDHTVGTKRGIFTTSAFTTRLGSIEELLWLYDQTSPFHFVMGATFIGAGTAAPWREVLDALQRRHPLLRVRIERGASAYPTF